MSKKKGIATRSPKGLVLDCSIVMAWYFVDESSEYADEVARRLPRKPLSFRSTGRWKLPMSSLWANEETLHADPGRTGC